MGNEVNNINVTTGVEYILPAEQQGVETQQDELLIDYNNESNFSFSAQDEQNALNALDDAKNGKFSKEMDVIAKNDELVKNAKVSHHKGATIYKDEQGNTIRIEKDIEGMFGKTKHLQTDYTYTSDENGNKTQTAIHSSDGKIDHCSDYSYDKNGKLISSVSTNTNGKPETTQYIYGENGEQIGRYTGVEAGGKVSSLVVGNNECRYINVFGTNVPYALAMQEPDPANPNQAVQNIYLSKTFIKDTLSAIAEHIIPKAYADNGKEKEKLPGIEDLNRDNFYSNQIRQKVRNINGKF